VLGGGFIKSAVSATDDHRAYDQQIAAPAMRG
jgi:hypothetical protein